MQTLINALRQVVGSADFYQTSGSYGGTWDYGAMIEYMVASLLLLVVVASIFRLLGRLCGK